MTYLTKLQRFQNHWFDRIDGFIRVRGGEFRYLVLFDYGFDYVIRLNML